MKTSIFNEGVFYFYVESSLAMLNTAWNRTLDIEEVA